MSLAKPSPIIYVSHHVDIKYISFYNFQSYTVQKNPAGQEQIKHRFLGYKMTNDLLAHTQNIWKK